MVWLRMLAPIAFLLPITASAATITSVNDVSSNTGGITVSAGQSVSSQGESVSEVQTVIHSGNSGDTAELRVTTEKNGVRETSQQTVQIPAGASVDLTSGIPKKATQKSQASVQITKQHNSNTKTAKTTGGSTAVQSSATVSSAATAPTSATQGLMGRIRLFVSRIFSGLFR